MSNNPFDNEAGQFTVLVNHLHQHSLWPDFATVPAGWTVAYGPASRDDCLDYVRTNWTDIAPRRGSGADAVPGRERIEVA